MKNTISVKKLRTKNKSKKCVAKTTNKKRTQSSSKKTNPAKAKPLHRIQQIKEKINQPNTKDINEQKSITEKFPKRVPFWARTKYEKRRPALIIDKTQALNKKTKKMEDGFVYREVTHKQKGNEYTEVKPNPDEEDRKKGNKMFLKRPQKKPKILFEPLNKDWEIPQDLIDKYTPNNSK